MKKHVVFIIGAYGTYVSPGANIVTKVRDVLQKNPDLEITTIAHKTHFSDCADIEENLILVQDTWTCIHNMCQEKLATAKGLKKVWYKGVLLFKKAVHYSGMLFRLYSYSPKLKQKTFRVLKQLDKEKKIDVVIPCGEPHDAIFAGLAFKKKHPSVTFLPYQLDRYANGNSLYKFPKLQKGLTKRNLKKEEEVLMYAKKLYVLKPIYPHYQDKRFAMYQDKIVSTEHPLLVQHPCVNAVGKDDMRITVMYAGSLDKTLRNPKCWLETLQCIQQKNELPILHKMFSFGNCQDILSQYEKGLESCFINAGKISYDQVIKEYQSTDFILTIGNNSKEEVPSKIFDCMSYGKPMIHLYYCEEDPSIPYLQRYPYALCLPLQESQIQANADDFIHFCKDYYGKVLAFSDVVEVFQDCTPEYIAEKFEEQI